MVLVPVLVGKSQSLVDLGGVVVNQVADKQDQQLHKQLLCFIYIDLFTRSSTAQTPAS
jgi:hypothetical protein